MSPKVIKFGTRGSLLAKTQTQSVISQLEEFFDDSIEIIIIKTEGDDPRNSITSPSRPGVFVSSLRDALLSGEVDVIVHSYKDLPSALHEGIALAAVPEREDVRDVLVSKNNINFRNLPSESIVGTSSPRRKSFVNFERSDLVVKPIRGNIDSRIEKLKTGEFDAIIMAAAGLKRIKRTEIITELFETSDLIPAPAQGALAIECRGGESDLIKKLKAIDNHLARVTTLAERSFLGMLGASCQTAVGATAHSDDNGLTLAVELADEDGSRRERRVKRVAASKLDFKEIVENSQQLAKEILETDLAKKIFQ